METIINFIINLFSGITGSAFGREIVVFIISMLPILELRGGLLASALLKVNPIVGYIVSMIGNIIPVPFILLFINKILNWMEKSKVKWINSLAKWIRKKADKHKGQIEKYGYVGLLLFVGIPLPGTGAWTGCLIASVLNMDKKKSFLAAAIGVLMAGIIISVLSIGLFDGLLK